MKILITGAYGYIGKSLYLKFFQQHDITLLNKDILDLTDSRLVNDFFRNKYFDIVIHCAVIGGSRLKKDEWKTLDQNLMMYYNLLNCKHSFKKLIHFGSGAELYDNENPYGYSKSVIRKSILNNDGFYNLRIFAVFDENELDTRFIKANIKKYINKEQLIIHKNKVMDFIYMQDLLKIVEYYVNNDGPKEINCNYSIHYELFDIATIINSLNSYKVDIIVKEEGLALSYADTHFDLGLDFAGLKQGIVKTYNKIIHETIS